MLDVEHLHLPFSNAGGAQFQLLRPGGRVLKFAVPISACTSVQRKEESRTQD